MSDRVRSPAPSDASAGIEAGREALARGEWEKAQRAFESEMAAGETAEALEGLAEACWWQHDETATFDARERAYHLYRRDGDRRGAAHMATNLAIDSLEFRGQPVVANGWLARGHRLLDGLEETPEYGWLTLWEGYLTLNLENDTVAARRLASQAAEAGRTLGVLDLEMLALAIEGLALVGEGEIAEGMRRLDEAATAAVTGEMSDRSAVWTTLCSLMTACGRVRDYDRAVQWCARVMDLSQQWKFDALFTTCRPQYASVLMWRGQWDEAEVQLLAANRERLAIRPPMVIEGIVRLAELRWRQGRWDEAERLFEQVKGEGLALPGWAELALSRGDATLAIDLLDRYLRQIPSEDRMERAGPLEVLVRSLVSAGHIEGAEAPLAELRRIVAHVRTDALKASANFAGGVLAAARGDLGKAKQDLEDAVDLFERHSAPFEAARVRLELASALSGMGRRVEAGREATMALQGFRRVGAAGEAERASAFLEQLETEATDATRNADPAGLSPREIEVLRLIATGKSSQEIAEGLFLSLRTVERHISTIYEKIGAHGRAARAAATAYALSNGYGKPI